MKSKIIIINLFLILLMGPIPEAKSFYNPSTGRWLSRDPIAEGGGKNLYALVNNDPVQKVDRLGLEVLCYYDVNGVWTCRSPIEGCCNGKTYLYSTHCCRDGKIIAKAPIETGVIKHKWSENPNGPGMVHVWLTWDGGSADSNADALTTPPGSGKVSMPAGATRSPSKDEAIKLSPCDYDFKKLNSCLSQRAKELIGSPGGDCRAFADSLLDYCKGKSKGFTVPK